MGMLFIYMYLLSLFSFSFYVLSADPTYTHWYLKFNCFSESNMNIACNVNNCYLFVILWILYYWNEDPLRWLLLRRKKSFQKNIENKAQNQMPDDAHFICMFSFYYYFLFVAEKTSNIFNIFPMSKIVKLFATLDTWHPKCWRFFFVTESSDKILCKYIDEHLQLT